MANLTSAQLAQLSQDYQSLAQSLISYKLNNTANLTTLEFTDLGNRIALIIHNSNILAALSVCQLAADVSSQLNGLKEATSKIDTDLKTINSVQKVIDIATVVVNLGTSVLSSDVNGIISNISTLVNV